MDMDERPARRPWWRRPLVWLAGGVYLFTGGSKRQLLGILSVGKICHHFIYKANLQTVPYTGRTHCVMLRNEWERCLGEQAFSQLRRAWGENIVPADDPQTLRVRKIAAPIIAAAMSAAGVTPQDLEQAPSDHPPPWWAPHLNRLSEAPPGQVGHPLFPPYGGYLQHCRAFDWEVVVIKDETVNAACCPGGKIFVHTGLLEKFLADAEVAAVLGHEVGHALARHSAESMTSSIWLHLLLALLTRSNGSAVGELTQTLLLPYSRRAEFEADMIGLMLMAAAGFDPSVAPATYEALEQPGEAFLQYLGTHPAARRRANTISKSSGMVEAKSIYLRYCDKYLDTSST